MENEYQSQRFEVHLPISVWAPDHTLAHGVTESISSHDIRFAVDKSLALKKGAPIALRVSLPLELTGGNHVLLRASGQVVATEGGVESAVGRITVVATLDWYDFLRGEASNARRILEWRRSRAAGSPV